MLFSMPRNASGSPHTFDTRMVDATAVDCALGDRLRVLE